MKTTLVIFKSRRNESTQIGGTSYRQCEKILIAYLVSFIAVCKQTKSAHRRPVRTAPRENYCPCFAAHTNCPPPGEKSSDQLCRQHRNQPARGCRWECPTEPRSTNCQGYW